MTGRGKPSGRLKVLTDDIRPAIWWCWAVSRAGPLPSIIGGSDHLLDLVSATKFLFFETDLFTNWEDAEASSEQPAAAVAKFFFSRLV